MMEKKINMKEKERGTGASCISKNEESEEQRETLKRTKTSRSFIVYDCQLPSSTSYPADFDDCDTSRSDFDVVLRKREGERRRPSQERRQIPRRRQ